MGNYFQLQQMLSQKTCNHNDGFRHAEVQGTEKKKLNNLTTSIDNDVLLQVAPLCPVILHVKTILSLMKFFLIRIDFAYLQRLNSSVLTRAVTVES